MFLLAGSFMCPLLTLLWKKFLNATQPKGSIVRQKAKSRGNMKFKAPFTNSIKVYSYLRHSCTINIILIQKFQEITSTYLINPNLSTFIFG